MQTSTRTVSRARARALPCGSLRSVETGTPAAAPPGGGTEQRGAGARQPGAGPGAAKLEETEPSASALAGGGDGGMSSRGPRPGGWPPLTHVQAGGELEDGGHWGCEPA